jgi:tetratricopeptide (TPR) repeat protein
MADKFPEVPESHIVGRQALAVFTVRCPREWIVTPSVHDYGWDGFIEIGTKGLSFFIQMKGSSGPSYSKNKDFVSVVLKVSTINSLQNRSDPTMVCACDTGMGDRPIYWVWLDEAMEDVSNKNTDWEQQETVTIRIPTNQTIDQNVSAKVLEYVSERRDRLKIGKEILDVMGIASGVAQEQMRSSPVSDLVEQAIKPTLIRAGLIDASTFEGLEQVDVLSPDDQRRLKEIKEISVLLNVFEDEEAAKRLDRLKDEIEYASDGVKAGYFNNKGILMLHQRDEMNALPAFIKASELRPSEPKYTANVLWVEFSIDQGAEKGTTRPEWRERLDKFLSSNPTFGPAVRLKAMQMAHDLGPKAAVEYVTNSVLWEKEPLDSRTCLLEVLRDAEDYDQAIKLIQRTERDGITLNTFFYALAGSIFFLKAIGGYDNSRQFSFIAGPPTIKLELLQKAESYHRRAFEAVVTIGFPLAWTEIAQNYCLILTLHGKYDDAMTAAKAFLLKHPENPQINDLVASALIGKGEPENAVPFARKAYAGDPSSLNLQHLCQALFLCQDYEELMKTVSENRKNGFEDMLETRIMRPLCAIAYSELGDKKKSDEQIKTLESEGLVGEAVAVKCTIARKNGESKTSIADTLEKALQDYPDNAVILTHLIDYLNPTIVKDAEKITSAFGKLLRQRELLPEEYSKYAFAVGTLNRPEEARDILMRAVKHYPGIPSLIHDLALAVEGTGDQETAYRLCSDYIRVGGKSYAILKNTAILAEMTGRIDDAIKLFSNAITKTQDSREIGDIHCQLYELKRRKGTSVKELMSHIDRFGKTIPNREPEREARYLVMMLLAPRSAEPIDEEMQSWIEEGKRRLTEFKEKNPKFPFLRSFKIDTTLSPEEQSKELLTTITAETLPSRIRRAQLEMAARGGPWPFALRGGMSDSIFSYWSLCTQTNVSSHAVHIWTPDIPLEEENNTARMAREVCVDIVALLALAELDILDILTTLDRVIISLGTMRAIGGELNDLFKGPHPHATRISTWLASNKRLVRVRHITDSPLSGLGNDTQKSIILTSVTPSPRQIMGCGIGESLSLISSQKLILYSDDVFTRYAARMDGSTKTFSTISLLRALREKGRVQLSRETQVLARMIRLNFRIVPFEPVHLMSALEELIESLRSEGRVPKQADMLNDKSLGTLLRQFGESSLNVAPLQGIATDWWVAIVEKRFSSEILEASMSYPVYALSQRSVGGVLTGWAKDEPIERGAALLALFLLKIIQRNKRLTPRAWSAAKACCYQHYGEKDSERIIRSRMPALLVKWIELQPVDDNEKAQMLVTFTEALPYEDKATVEVYIIQRIKPSFSK